MPPTPTVSIGVSLKMYFGHRRALEWCSAAAEVARADAAVAGGQVELFVIPSFPSIPGAIAAVDGTPVVIGAQDLYWEDSGAFTGEVSGAELAELGCSVVEIGHAERRRLFGETDETVALKTAAALRNGLAPVLCLGETEQGTADDAIADVLTQLASAVEGAPPGRIIAAYEPVWAIGADEPASPDHIRAVCSAVRAALEGLPGRDGSRVIYGGSAGPGLLTRLGDDVDGLFLGRFAHDPAALAAVLQDAAALASRRVDASTGGTP